MAGEVNWIDLTVPDAVLVRDFYQAVAGWTASGVEMGGYQDFSMAVPGSGKVVGGICHARGENAGLPPSWLIYINVASLDEAMKQCRARGGQVIYGPRDMGGYGRMCVIRDPAGAVAGLMEPAASGPG
jgi:predicted enzyme related to lactoylglutathione lyase